MLTINADAHPLMRRMHKPDLDLPADKQDKRSVVVIEASDFDAWLGGTADDATALIRLAPAHHDNDPGETLTAVRRFLAAKATVELPPNVIVCGHSVIVESRARFNAGLPALAVAAGIEADEIGSFEHAPKWIARGATWQASTLR